MIDFDSLTDREAELLVQGHIDRRGEVAWAIIEMTLLASPGAGPVRVLRELEAA